MAPEAETHDHPHERRGRVVSLPSPSRGFVHRRLSDAGLSPGSIARARPASEILPDSGRSRDVDRPAQVDALRAIPGHATGSSIDQEAVIRAKSRCRPAHAKSSSSALSSLRSGVSIVRALWRGGRAGVRHAHGRTGCRGRSRRCRGLAPHHRARRTAYEYHTAWPGPLIPELHQSDPNPTPAPSWHSVLLRN